MIPRPGLVLFLTLGACSVPQGILENVRKTEETLLMAHKVYAPLCAPEELANAVREQIVEQLEKTGAPSPSVNA